VCVVCVCNAVRSQCADDQFECKVIFECIPKEKYRDGVNDCFDLTDEPQISKILLFSFVTCCFLFMPFFDFFDSRHYLLLLAVDDRRL